jgi:hypothetical protein
MMYPNNKVGLMDIRNVFIANIHTRRSQSSTRQPFTQSRITATFHSTSRILTSQTMGSFSTSSQSAHLMCMVEACQVSGHAQLQRLVCPEWNLITIIPELMPSLRSTTSSFDRWHWRILNCAKRRKPISRRGSTAKGS